MSEPVQVEEHGQMVWQDNEIDDMRLGVCLCRRCEKFNPGRKNNCNIAEQFFAICKRYGCAFILTRCSEWEKIIPF